MNKCCYHDSIGLGHQEDSLSPTVTTERRDIWLAALTLLENSFPSLSHGWLWAGLYFMLLILVGLTSVFGFLEVVISSLVSIKPSLSRLKPGVALFVISLIYLLDLALATQGGIHIYHLLTTYISSWPAILFSLLTVLATILCHGSRNIMKDLGDMSKILLPHWVTSHLTVIYCSVLPIILTVSTN